MNRLNWFLRGECSNDIIWRGADYARRGNGLGVNGYAFVAH